ncbi:DUF2281 domain-containing protein [Candidatus Chloroploca sp. M-50]|uniref:DUF2281 domain-containing protein n=2 Tax=Candidatus Chloroploca TaxID=1579476 RepID=A0A2H3KPK1_9CHLR|nr:MULTISPECIES: DUF2281 domain-containing protein [Candidatus Chloroploca]MBP1466598.1 DUF2281 domain-containing protein [Candidatus Chloroploca mongolica]PDW00178.1 hypothetical protein A9Q02_21935 [Candidatus Chloroploca asiatica]
MTLEEKIRELPNELQREVEDFVEFLLVKQRRAELERTAIAMGWPAGFFARIAGSIDDPTFVRGDQGVAEERLPLE